MQSHRFTHQSIIDHQKIGSNNTTLSDIPIYQELTAIPNPKHIMNLINLRKQFRNNTLKFLLQQNYYQAIQECQNLLNHDKIIKEFMNKSQKKYNLTQFFPTTTIFFITEIESLMDFLIYIRVLSKRGETALIQKRIIYMQFLDFQIIKKNTLDTKQFNLLKSQISAYESILKALILITNDLNLIQASQKLQEEYISLIKKHYGQLELSSTYFEYGIYYFNIYNKAKKIQNKLEAKQKTTKYQKAIINNNKELVMKAKFYFELSKQIGNKYVPNLNYANAITNLSFIQYEIHHKILAKQYLNQAIRIKLDLINRQKQRQKIDCSRQYEMLGKILLEEGDFVLSYENLKKCYKIKKLYKQKERENQRKRIEVLIIFLFRTLSKNSEYSIGKEKLDYKSLSNQIQKQMFELENFQRYIIYKNKKNYKIQLKFSQQAFNSLSYAQILEYQKVQQRLKNLSIDEGIKFLNQSQFSLNLQQFVRKQIKSDIQEQYESFKKMKSMEIQTTIYKK